MASPPSSSIASCWISLLLATSDAGYFPSALNSTVRSTTPPPVIISAIVDSSHGCATIFGHRLASSHPPFPFESQPIHPPLTTSSGKAFPHPPLPSPARSPHRRSASSIRQRLPPSPSKPLIREINDPCDRRVQEIAATYTVDNPSQSPLLHFHIAGLPSPEPPSIRAPSCRISVEHRTQEPPSLLPSSPAGDCLHRQVEAASPLPLFLYPEPPCRSQATAFVSIPCQANRIPRSCHPRS